MNTTRGCEHPEVAFIVEATDPRYDEIARVYERWMHANRERIMADTTGRTLAEILFGIEKR